MQAETPCLLTSTITAAVAHSQAHSPVIAAKRGHELAAPEREPHPMPGVRIFREFFAVKLRPPGVTAARVMVYCRGRRQQRGPHGFSQHLSRRQACAV